MKSKSLSLEQTKRLINITSHTFFSAGVFASLPNHPISSVQWMYKLWMLVLVTLLHLKTVIITLIIVTISNAQLLLYLDFFQQLVHAGVPLLQVYSLYGTFLVARLAVGRVNHGRRADADHLLHFVVGGRVGPWRPRRLAAVGRRCRRR